MKYEEKEVLFSNFQNDWGNQLKKIPHLLKYIASYSEVTKHLDDFEVKSLDELNKSQLEWVSLVNQFEHETETTFFKPYWVPIQKEKYDYFIDLSSDNLPLFEADFFFQMPHQWYKKYLYKDSSQFLMDMNKSGFNMEQHLNRIEPENNLIVREIFNKRDVMGFAGKIDPRELSSNVLFCQPIESKLSIYDNVIKVTGVNSVIIKLLPQELKIELEHFQASSNNKKNVCQRIKSLKGLGYLLDSIGLFFVSSYSISFNKDDNRADFKDNTFTLIHTNQEVINQFRKRYDEFKKEISST